MTLNTPSLNQLLVRSRPSLSTAQALIALDFQNDFLAEDGKLPVTTSSSFQTAFGELIHSIRQASGHVIWVRTHFDPTVDPGEASVYRHDFPASAEDDNAASEDSEDEFFKTLVANDRLLGNRPSAKRTIEILRKAAHRTRPTVPDEFFLTDQMDPSKQCCLPGSLGSGLSATVSSMQHERDIDITKNTYSAFQGTSLLEKLRLRMVTTLYLCGSMTSMSVYATARDAVAYGYSVKIITDCLGYLSKPSYQQALQGLQDIIGAELVTSSALIRQQTQAAAADRADDPMQEILDKLIDITNLCDKPPSQIVAKAIEVEHKPHRPKSESPVGGVAYPNPETPQNMHTHPQFSSITAYLASSARTASTSSTPNFNMSANRTQAERRIRPPAPIVKTEGDQIAEDSRILFSAVSEVDTDLFAKLKREIHWQKMYHSYGQVPRLVCTQGTFGSDGSMPVYRHPSDQSLPLLHYSTIVERIKNQVENIVGHPMNHVLIQLYRNGEDFISEHSDKTLDIVRGSNIVNVSLGAQRTMRLRTKKSSVSADPETKNSTRTTQIIPMPHGSVFVLGPKSNEKWLHGINHDKRPLNEKTEAEKAFGGERISLTFRQIGTFLDGACRRIWGQGACSKSQSSSHFVINGVEDETQRMINAFGFENQQSEFDWDAVYGNGFDVLHFREPPPEDRLLFLSGITTSDLRVRIFLEEISQPYQIARAATYEPGSEFHPDICLRDCDSHRTQVFGDIPILLYLNQTSAGQALRQPALADAFHQLWALKDIVTASTPGEGVLKLEEILKNQEYIATEFSLADCAYWPVVKEIVETWDKWQPLHFPAVDAYHNRMSQRSSVIKSTQPVVDGL